MFNRLGFISSLALMTVLGSWTAYADEGQRAYKPRAEANIRAGTERSILMTEFWLPLHQQDGSVTYADARIMGDDHDNREWNLGLGYRALNPQATAVNGVHGWLDRRRTTRGSVFYQATAGYEYLTEGLDIRLNGYIPFNQEEKYGTAVTSTTPYLADTGIYYDTGGQLVEKPMHGFDIEFSVPVNLFADSVDSFRVSAGGFVFDADGVDALRGFRLRAAADITSDVQLGARFEADNQRGAQGFVEATLRFPFGAKASARTHQNLRSRLDESPERDIDIITSTKQSAPTQRHAIISVADGAAQRVFHVDNSATSSGDGTVANPFNTLAAAAAAANRAGDIIYVNRGDGSTTGQDQGITLAYDSQTLIGSGAAFIYDGTRFATASGDDFTGTVLRAAGAAPVITNANLNGDGINISAADVIVTGITVDGAARNGIYALATGGTNLGTLTLNNLNLTNNAADGVRVESSGAGSLIDASIANITASGNNDGVRFYAQQNASASGTVSESVMTANARHGVILYDDSTAGSINVDLGGGGRSDGFNSFYSNGLEEIAVELDGGTLMARNNWWGQTSGLYQLNPAGGISPQVYFGAPLDASLVGHWTFDTEWTSNTTAYDRSGYNNNGTLNNLTTANLVSGIQGEAMSFNGTTQYVRVEDSPSLSMSHDLTFIVYVQGSGASQTIHYARPFSKDSNASNPALPAGIGNGYELQVASYGTGAEIRIDSSALDNRIFQAGNPFDGNWHASATSISSTAVATYVDGVLASASTNNLGNGVNNPDPLFIGRSGQLNRYFRGNIDSVLVFNRALTGAEIAEVNRMDTSSGIDAGSALNAAP